MENFIYAHYFPLSSQGNIYSMTKLTLANGSHKILVASLKREIICFDYCDEPNVLSPCAKEVLFTYIPNGAEIISLDAFSKSKNKNEFVVGITIIKTEASKESYLNIYSSDENEFNIDNIAQNCLTIDLSFIPYQLYHTYIIDQNEDEPNDSHEVVMLLAGSDSKIHLYRENKQIQSYKEENVEEHFIELENPPNNVIYMDIFYFDNFKKRVTVLCCELGNVIVTVTNTLENTVLQSWSIQLENIVSQVKIFQMKPEINYVNDDDNNGNPILNLIVTNTALPSIVFMNILEEGLSERYVLNKSNIYNVASCTCVADIDLDGQNEILIGTYGQEILAYKFNSLEWQLIGKKSFANPIYSMFYIDITGDGVKELIVLTLKGVHILQLNSAYTARVFEEKLKLLNCASNAINPDIRLATFTIGNENYCTE